MSDIEGVLDRLNGRDCDKDCWLTHKDDDQDRAKQDLLNLILKALPEVPPYPVESDDLLMLHEGAVQGFQDAIKDTEEAIRKVLG